MFPAMVLIAWRPPSLRRVPASPVPRPLRYYEAATTSRRACPSAYVFASGFRPGSIVRVRCRAPADVRAHRRARSFVHPALQGPGLFHTGDDGTSQVPWRPLPRLCPALRPRPNRSRLAMSSRSMLPPDPTRRRLRRFHDFEAATGLQRPLSTLHERRCRRPCKTRFRLAGSAFAGRASNPLGRFERFQVTSILLSRAYPDASWSHLRRRFYDLVKGGNAPIAGEALERIAARDKTPRRVARRVVETIAGAGDRRTACGCAWRPSPASRYGGHRFDRRPRRVRHRHALVFARAPLREHRCLFRRWAADLRRFASLGRDRRRAGHRQSDREDRRPSRAHRRARLASRSRSGAGANPGSRGERRRRACANLPTIFKHWTNWPHGCRSAGRVGFLKAGKRSVSRSSRKRRRHQTACGAIGVRSGFEASGIVVPSIRPVGSRAPVAGARRATQERRGATDGDQSAKSDGRRQSQPYRIARDDGRITRLTAIPGQLATPGATLMPHGKKAASKTPTDAYAERPVVTSPPSIWRRRYSGRFRQEDETSRPKERPTWVERIGRLPLGKLIRDAGLWALIPETAAEGSAYRAAWKMRAQPLQGPHFCACFEFVAAGSVPLSARTGTSTMRSSDAVGNDLQAGSIGALDPYVRL